MTELPSLGREAHYFSIAVFLGRHIILSGGGFESAVSAIDTETRQWENLPSMNHPRRHHASLVLAGYLYVIGGYNVNSIERLRLFNDHQWTLLLQDDAVRHRDLAASAISHHEIAIFGGGEKSGVVFDTLKNSLKTILG